MEKKHIAMIAGALLGVWLLLSLTAPPATYPNTTSVDQLGNTVRWDTKYSDLKNVLLTEPQAVSRVVILKDYLGEPTSVALIMKRGHKKEGYEAELPSRDAEAEIRALADKNAIDYAAKREPMPRPPTPSGGTVILAMLPQIMMMVFFGAMVFFMFKQYQNMQGGSKMAKSKHRKFEPDKGPKVTFKDVAGTDEAKEDVQMVVEFLKDPSEIKELGGKAPKCILLVGPPGTGKTLLAKAVAGEANVPFFYINASEFVEMYVGVGAARVRDMFEEVRKSLPCILAIDELDAVAQHRGTGIGGGNDERQQTINQLLTEIDGFENNEGLVAFAMTNRPDVLDPAIVRSGRFGDKKITVPLPDRHGRMEIIKVHAEGVKLDRSIDFDELATHTAGFSGADIAALLKVHGPGFAIKRHRKLFGLGKKASLVTREDLDRGIAQIQMGSSNDGKSKRLSDGVKRLLAYHELGHAIVAEYLYRLSSTWENLWSDPVRKVTIIGAGGAGGYTLIQGDEDPFCLTREQILGQITGLLAANRAESKFLSTTSTGAQNDFERAYDLAKRMVTKWGMSDLGPISVGSSHKDPFLGRSLAEGGGYGLGVESSNQIDHEIKQILDRCTARADEILDKMEPLIHMMAPILIRDETLLREQFVGLFDQHYQAE
ncbi:MAG: ATP-dependent metallopeptidase FtsH/Yme1/Tma family protein [Candidatus Obscuribacterales bacterium]